MFVTVEAATLSALMLPMSRRAGGKGVYFARLTQSSAEALNVLWAYHEAARNKGVIIEGQMGNPDERQLRYLQEMLGEDFTPEEAFVREKLRKWMPRMSENNQAEFTRALMRQLMELRSKGKPETVLRNVYFKVMCWLYYRFERLMPFLGEDDPPRILYECSTVTAHELMLLRILAAMGTDVLLLETAGDAGYCRIDPESAWSQRLPVPGGTPFPANFTLKQFRKERMAARPAAAVPHPSAVPRPTVVPQMGTAAHSTAGHATTMPHLNAVPLCPTPGARSTSVPRLNVMPTRPSVVPHPTIATNTPRPIDPESYFPKPKTVPCTNTWMKTAELTQLLVPPQERGAALETFCNALLLVRGAKDAAAYPGELHRLYQSLQEQGRRVVAVDDGLPMPTPEETARIRRRNYRSAAEMAVDLAGNLPACANVELQRLMQQSFVRTMMQAAKTEENLNRLMTSGVYLLCWIARYQGALFEGYQSGQMPCLLLLGGCKNAHDALYPVYLSGLPADVAVLSPDLSAPCTLQSEKALLLAGDASLRLAKFPRDAASVRVDTAAADAERELNQTLYQDSGLFRTHQFARADAVVLQGTLDEAFLLWDQELKYRTGFDASGTTVTMPVLYARICGVQGGAEAAYWTRLRRLLTPETMLCDHLPMLVPGAANPYQSLAQRVLKNGRLLRDSLRADREYPFGMLREDMQTHMLDKLQLMLDQRLIRGIGENGTEYTVVAVVLAMRKDFLQRLQSFDFTRKNPKIVLISTNDSAASLEDAILLTFLSLVGFDIALFVPTGYQTIERYLNDHLPVAYQAGEYRYDMTVPDLTAPQPKEKPRTWWENLQRSILNR